MRLGPPPKGYANCILRLHCGIKFSSYDSWKPSATFVCASLVQKRDDQRARFKTRYRHRRPMESSSPAWWRCGKRMRNRNIQYVLCFVSTEQPVQLIREARIRDSGRELLKSLHVIRQSERAGSASIFIFAEALAG